MKLLYKAKITYVFVTKDKSTSSISDFETKTVLCGLSTVDVLGVRDQVSLGC